MTAQDELRALARHLLFWIAGGTATGAGLVALGIFLLWQRLHPAQANPPWLADLGAVWIGVLAFGLVVWAHAFDVWTDRRILLRTLHKLQTEDLKRTPPS